MVTIESEASPPVRKVVERIFAERQISDLTVQQTYVRESADLLPWLITIGAPLGIFLAQVGKTAGDEAGKDAWRVLREFVLELYRRRREVDGNSGTVSIRDSETNVQIILSEDLPDRAYQKLREMQKIEAPFSGRLTWDELSETWVDPLRSRFPCEHPSCDQPASISRKAQNESGWVRLMLCDEHGGVD